MAPKRHFRQMPAADQVSALHNRATKLTQGQHVKYVNTTLKARPDLAELTAGYLKSLVGPESGATPAAAAAQPQAPPMLAIRDGDGAAAEGATPALPPAPAGPLALEGGQLAIEDGAGPPPPEGAGETNESPPKVRRLTEITDADPKSWIPHRYTKFSNSSIEFLKQVLSAIDPVALSPYILNAVYRTGPKQERVDGLCDNLEFVTGVDRESALVGDLRHIPTLLEHLRELAGTMGGRTAGLAVPVEWPKCGVYSLAETSGRLVVTQRFSKISIVVPPAMRLQTNGGDIIPIGSLHIANNCSDAKAVIASSETLKTVAISSLGIFSHAQALVTGLHPSTRGTPRSSTGDGLSRSESSAALQAAGTPVRSASSVGPRSAGSADTPARGSEAAGASPHNLAAAFDEAAWAPEVVSAPPPAEME